MSSPLISLWSVLIIINGQPLTNNILYENYMDCGAAGVGYAKTQGLYDKSSIYCKDVNSDKYVDIKKLFDKERDEWERMNKDFNSPEAKEDRCMRQFNADTRLNKPFPKCVQEIIKRDRERVQNDPNSTFWDKFVNLAW